MDHTLHTLRDASTLMLSRQQPARWVNNVAQSERNQILFAHLLKTVCGLQFSEVNWDSHLDFSQNSGAVHPAGYIHRVAPDVVLRLLGSDDSGYYWTVVNT